MRKSIAFALFWIAVNSCSFFDPLERLWLKSIKTPDGRINWFTYSAAYLDDFPDYIVYESMTEADTLCRSDNVLGMYLAGQRLHLHFNGQPSLYTKPILLPASLHGYQIVLDTSSVPPSSKGRHYFRNMTEATATIQE